VLIKVDFAAAPAGTHALHVHTTGKCDAPMFMTAGGHFAPGMTKHGMLAAGGPHAGDLPNIYVPADGKLSMEILEPNVTLAAGPPLAPRRRWLGDRSARDGRRLHDRSRWQRGWPHRLRRRQQVGLRSRRRSETEGPACWHAGPTMDRRPSSDAPQYTIDRACAYRVGQAPLQPATRYLAESAADDARGNLV